jgi:streptogramin lyase
VWFTESNATKLGRFDPSNDTFKEYPVPGFGDMWGMTIDNQGNIWLTQYSLKGSVSPGGTVAPGGTGRLIRFNPTNGNFTVINISTPGAFPFRVTTDSEGKVWFTELLGNQIGCYDPFSGKLQEFAVPISFAGPADLAFDSRGTLWFTEAYNQSIAKFDPTTSTFVEYRFPVSSTRNYVGSPVGIAVASDSLIWIADHGGNWIVKFNATSQEITEIPTHFPPPDIYPISLVNDVSLDRQGRVWFTEHGGNSVGYFDPRTGQMVEYAIPTGPISTVLWLAIAPNGDVWFTEWSSNKLGVVHANLTIPLTLSASETSLSVPAAGQATLSLRLSSAQDFALSGAYEYAWPSYNQATVNVTFSPQNISLNAESQTICQATVDVSRNTLPGSYMMGLGFNVGAIRVWSIISTEVTPTQTTSLQITSNLWLPLGATFLILLGVLIGGLRIRQMRKPKNVVQEKPG